jgi:hypothetical protein
MANVFIYADDDATVRSYFDITVKKEYELETLSPLIEDESRIKELRMIYPEGKCYFWGVQESSGNFLTWDMMAKDDLVLGYRNHSIVFASYILAKMKNPLLADRLWGKRTEEPFSLLCFTTEPSFGDTVIEPQMSAYLDMDCRGGTCLKPEKRDNILRDYGSFEVFVRYGLGLDFPSNFRHSE